MRRTIMSLSVLTLVLTIALSAAIVPASAAPRGNSENAHLCQQGGWEHLKGDDGRRFSNIGDCVSYAARDGTLFALSPTIELTFAPTHNTQFCLLVVRMTDFDQTT